jgi:hypothetical protein
LDPLIKSQLLQNEERFSLTGAELSPNFGDGLKDQAAAWA